MANAGWEEGVSGEHYVSFNVGRIAMERTDVKHFRNTSVGSLMASVACTSMV